DSMGDENVFIPSPFGAEIASVEDAAEARELLSVREQLTAARTYYVDPNGSNGNDGLTPGTAFQTISHAVSVAYTLDTAIYNVTIQLADGTWTEPVIAQGVFVGGGTITIRGN